MREGRVDDEFPICVGGNFAQAQVFRQLIGTQLVFMELNIADPAEVQSLQVVGVVGQVLLKVGSSSFHIVGFEVMLFGRSQQP